MIASLLRMYWKQLAVAGLVVAAGWGIHHHGYASGYAKADISWHRKWSERDEADNKAKITAQANALAEGVRITNQIGEIQKDAQTRIANANRAADDSRNAYDRLHREADRLAAAIDAGDSATIDRIRATGTSPVRVYADLFRRADERAGILAGVADRAIERGLTCQIQYEALRRSVTR